MCKYLLSEFLWRFGEIDEIRHQTVPWIYNILVLADILYSYLCCFGHVKDRGKCMEKVKVDSMINGTAARTETVPDAQKEAEILKARVEMEASQLYMEASAKQIAKIKENLEKKHATSSRELERSGRDTANISETRKWSGTGQTDPENPDSSWRLEMEAEKWNAFLTWKPVPGTSLALQIQDLSDKYLALLEAVLKYTMGEALTEQMARLDSALSENLNLLMDSDLGDLTALLEDTGQNDTLFGVLASVYKQTTGQSISHSEAAKILRSSRFSMTPSSGSFSNIGRESGRIGSGRGQGGSSSGSPRTSASSGASSTRSASLNEGMIYRASGGGKVQPSKGFAAQRNLWEGQISQRKAAINNARQGNRQGISTWGDKDSYTGRELTRANRFASHINGSGDLFRNSGITAQNDEVLGLLAAVTSMKGQIYAAEAGQKSSINLPLQNAITKMIDQYIRQKAASKVYYYTTHIYEKTKSPQKAIENGLEYAYRQFKEKQADPSCQTQAKYSGQAGFFLSTVNDQNSEKDFTFGLRILEENWKEFLRSIGKAMDSSSMLKLQSISPWGSLMEPAKHKAGKRVDIEKFLLVATVIFIAAAMIYFLLYP